MINTFLEGNLNDAGTGCPYVSEDKLAGKKTNMAAERTFARIQGKKVCDFQKMEQTT